MRSLLKPFKSDPPKKEETPIEKKVSGEMFSNTSSLSNFTPSTATESETTNGTTNTLTSEYSETETEETSSHSLHPSATSYNLSSLIEESHDEIDDFVKLRDCDYEWMTSVHSFVDGERPFRRIIKPIKVARRLMCTRSKRPRWSALVREVIRRNPEAYVEYIVDDVKPS